MCYARYTKGKGRVVREERCPPMVEESWRGGGFKLETTLLAAVSLLNRRELARSQSKDIGTFGTKPSKCYFFTGAFPVL